MRPYHVLIGVTLALAPTAASTGQEVIRLQFDFGSGPAPDGYQQVDPDDKYSDAAGFGFVDPVGETGGVLSGVDRGGGEPICADYCTSDKPFAFAVKLPEGNYRVAVTLGDLEEESTTSIHAEVRRLLADRLQLSKGEVGRFSAVVNVRTPHIADGRTVRLKSRERAE